MLTQNISGSCLGWEISKTLLRLPRGLLKGQQKFTHLPSKRIGVELTAELFFCGAQGTSLGQN